MSANCTAEMEGFKNKVSVLILDSEVLVLH